MNISTVNKRQNTLLRTESKPSAPASKPKAQANPAEDQVNLGQASERVNWTDVKALGGLALAGGAIGATPVLGAGIGAFEMSMGSIFGDGESLLGSTRGLIQVASNIAGSASLAMGFLPGAVLGLGASALISGGAFVADNMMGKELMTSEPPMAKEPPSEDKPQPPSAGRLAKAAGIGAMTTALGAAPGFGLLMGLNAGAADSEDDRPFQSLSAITTYTRMAGAAVSLLTLNPTPYIATVAANAVALGVDNAVATYKEG